MLGADPDGFAYDIQGIIQTGTLGTIDSAFYADAPNFHILAAVVGLIGDISSPGAMGVYPVLSGILYPLMTFLLIERMLPDKTSSWWGFVGAIVAAAGAVSIHFSYQPIAQTLSAFFWLFFVYMSMRYVSSFTWQSSIMISIFSVSMLYSHKLPLTVTLVVFAFVVFLMTSHLLIQSKWTPATQFSNVGQDINSDAILKNSFLLMALLFILLVIQYFYTTSLGYGVVSRFLGIFEPQSNAALYSGQIETSVATPIGTAIQDIVIRRLYGLILIPIAAISWIILTVNLLRGRSSAGSHIIALSTVVVTNLFIAVSLVAPVVGGTVNRFLLLSEPILIALIFVAFNDRFRIAKILAVLLITAMMFSGPVIAPDHTRSTDQYFGTEGAKKYLDAQDVAAKNYAHTRVHEQIRTDWWYAGERTPSDIHRYDRFARTTNYRPFDDRPLLTANLTAQGYGYVLLRDTSVVRTSEFGWYRLLWSPEEQFDSEYQRIYDNSGATLYNSRDTEGSMPSELGGS